LRFPQEEQFLEEFGALRNEEEVGVFKRMLKPYLLRRVKEDVEKLIPRLSEVIIDVEMTKIQKTIYKGLLEKNKNEMIKGLSTANLNNLAIQFRKCCNHPFLISPQLEEQLLKDARTPQQANETFLKVSGKMILLCKLLDKFKQQGKKALIFSQFVIMLELLQDHLEKVGYRCEMLHGGVSASNRMRAISRFSQDDQADVFLISTKAGGVGINLIAATEIVIYDSDWNPQNDIQATARAHRIGQKNEVTVYRLITANSYEAEMFQIASRKLGMDKAVFSGDFFKQGQEG
jgi:chromodomain-helicase-DNA-binding protein 7